MSAIDTVIFLAFKNCICVISNSRRQLSLVSNIRLAGGSLVHANFLLISQSAGLHCYILMSQMHVLGF